MNDSSSKISLVASRLPYTDRRALSEAWFSALHLASDAPLPYDVRERRGVLVSGATQAPAPHSASVPTGAVVRRSVPARVTRRTPTDTPAVDAPRVRPSRTRGAAVARTPNGAARSYAPFRTSLTVGVAKERVQLLLRRDGATLHVIALCRPHVVETVRRALALADTHLRIRGESVRSSVRPLDDAVHG